MFYLKVKTVKLRKSELLKNKITGYRKTPPKMNQNTWNCYIFIKSKTVSEMRVNHRKLKSLVTWEGMIAGGAWP